MLSLLVHLVLLICLNQQECCSHLSLRYHFSGGPSTNETVYLGEFKERINLFSSFNEIRQVYECIHIVKIKLKLFLVRYHHISPRNSF